MMAYDPITYSDDSDGSRGYVSDFLSSPNSDTYSEYYSDQTGPHMKIIEEPADYRYRYEKEKYHGHIVGISSPQNKKKDSYKFPAVQIYNYSGDVIVRCWLIANDGNGSYKAHFHKLNRKLPKGKIQEEPHDIHATQKNNHTATFDYMYIVHAVEKDKGDLDLYRRKKSWLESGLFDYLPSPSLANYTDELKTLDKNQSVLLFQAFDAVTKVKICESLTSRKIKNLHNPITALLKIVSYSRTSGSCDGGDEVFMFFEKISKDVEVRVVYESGHSHEKKIIWEEKAIYNQSQIHHQCGVVFKTPPFMDTNITAPHTCYFQLYRKNDGARSESRTKKFTYLPREHCNVKEKNPVKVPLHWNEPEENFKSAHIDYAGPFDGTHILGLINASQNGQKQEFPIQFQYFVKKRPHSELVIKEDPLMSECAVKKIKEQHEFGYASNGDNGDPVVENGPDLEHLSDVEFQTLILELNMDPNSASWGPVINPDIVFNDLFDSETKKLAQTDGIEPCGVRSTKALQDLPVAQMAGEVSWRKTEKSPGLVSTSTFIESLRILEILTKCIDMGDILRFKEILKSNRCDVNSVDLGGNSIFLISCSRALLFVQHLLKNEKVIKDITNFEGDNALLVAVKAQRIDIVEELLKNNFDANVQSYKSGETPLHAAVLCENLPLVKLLIEFEADPVSKTCGSGSPYDYSLDSKNPELRDYLRSKAQEYLDTESTDDSSSECDSFKSSPEDIDSQLQNLKVT